MGQTKDAREEIEQILESKEYQMYYDKSKNIFEIWWDNVKSWLADLLENLFPSIDSADGAAGFILMLIVIGILAFLGIGILLLVRHKRSTEAFKNTKPLHSVKELNWTYQKHMHEAMKQEDAKSYSLATRHLFLALLLYFHDREWLEAKIWKTNWEYFDELRRVNQSWADQFYHLALLFDEVTYGEHEIEYKEYLEFRKKVMEWFEDSGKTKDMKGERG